MWRALILGGILVYLATSYDMQSLLSSRGAVIAKLKYFSYKENYAIMELRECQMSINYDRKNQSTSII